MLFVLATGVFDSVGIEALPGLFPDLQKAGFKYLEVGDKIAYDNNMTVLDDLRKKSKEYGIEIPNWHLTMDTPFIGDSANSKVAIEYMKRSMEKGCRVGAQNHVLHWFQRFLDKGYDAVWRDIVDEWVEHAKHLGIRLLMETIPHSPLNQRYVPAAEVFEFVRTYPPEVMSICVDVNHSNIKEDLGKVVHDAQDRLVSLHVSDNDGCRDCHWFPGQGVIDFPYLFDSLEAIEFGGMIVMELKAWDKESFGLSEMKYLYECGMSLLETKHPLAGTVSLIK